MYEKISRLGIGEAEEPGPLIRSPATVEPPLKPINTGVYGETELRPSDIFESTPFTKVWLRS